MRDLSTDFAACLNAGESVHARFRVCFAGFTMLRRLELVGWYRVTVGDDGLSMDFSSAPSGRSDRVGVSGIEPAHRRAGGPVVSGAGTAFNPTAWPTIAVTCLAFESRIAAGP